MKTIVTTIDSRGRMTIPAEVRRHLNVGPFDKLSVVVTDEGDVELRPLRYTLASILGSLTPVSNESLDLEREIEAAMEEQAIGRARRLNYPKQDMT